MYNLSSLLGFNKLQSDILEKGEQKSQRRRVVAAAQALVQ